MQVKTEKEFNIDRAVMAMAGTFIIVSVVLSLAFSPWWLLMTLFVGANMLQASFTGFCPAAMIFRIFGLKSGCAFK